MPKRRISKASKRRLTVFGPIFLFFIIYFSFSFIYNIYKIIDLTNDKKNLENHYVQLQEEAEQLKLDIAKLNDKKYLADFARENYLYSKDGEYIIKIGEDLKDDLDETSYLMKKINSVLNKNYIVLILSGLVILIFIYILFKGRKRKK